MTADLPVPTIAKRRPSLEVEAEEVLREVAYVLHLARRVRREILQEREEQELAHA